MKNFWRFAKHILRYRTTLILALMAALTSAACYGGGIATIPLILNAMLGGEHTRSLSELAADYNARINNLVPQEWIDRGWTEGWRDGYGDQSAPVGKFGVNAFGLFDVHGNLWEWCRDWYVSYDQKATPGTGMRIGTSEIRVIRGGGFYNAARGARSAVRSRNVPEFRYHYLGFRPALDLPW